MKAPQDCPMILKSLGALVFGILLMTSEQARGTDVRGEQSGVWNLAGSPYIVTGDISVPAGASLIIEPGVIVKFSGPYSLRVHGTLRAVGSLTARIVFTSISDNEFGEDRPRNQSPSTNDWIGLVFANGIEAESHLEQCIIRYCRKPIEFEQGQSVLEKIIISDCSATTLGLNGVQIPIQDGIQATYSITAMAATPSNSLQREASTAAASPTSATPEEQFTFGEVSATNYALKNLSIFGYFSTRFEKVLDEPSAENGQTIKTDAPAEFTYPFFNIMLEHQLHQRFKIFINLNGSGAEEIRVQNFWGEYTFSSWLNLRLGKLYRRFGLYNEILDAMPSYYGIEPPELFDSDHLLISRTTAFMVYGALDAGPGMLNYSASTDNGEGDPVKNTFPLGYDVNYKLGGGELVLGTSGYTSGGQTNSTLGVGNGAPQSGVLPWMVADKFSILGGYAETRIKNLTVQAEYWRAKHNAQRDPAAILAVINNVAINANQLARFLRNPGLGATENNVATSAKYSIHTWYLRAGYSLESAIGEFGPYVQWDYYSNPETIANKDFGGDNEAGVADDGKFSKATLGLVFRPIPQVAVKLDGSSHFQKFHGATVRYYDLRLDVSYVFGQLF